MTSARRRLLPLICVLAALCVAVLHAATPTLGQHGAAVSASNTITLSPTGLTNGSGLIVGISQTGSGGSQTYSVADTNTNTYTSAVGPITTTGTNANRRCQIFYAKNITTTAGATTITVSMSGTATTNGQFVEMLGAHTTAPLDQTSSVADSADGTPHTAAVSITTAANIFAYSVMALNSTATFTPTSSPAFNNPTNLAADFASTASASQYYSNATGLSANNLAWTSGTARTAASCTASFVGASSSTRFNVGQFFGFSQ